MERPQIEKPEGDIRFELGVEDLVTGGGDEGVEGRRDGGRRKRTLPSPMAHRAGGAEGVIKPREPLVFVVDLLAVDCRSGRPWARGPFGHGSPRRVLGSDPDDAACKAR